MKLEDLDRGRAEAIIERLRKGTPPRRFASLYSAGMEDFVRQIRRRHLEPDLTAGKIRFVAGSWGAGKTHLFRLVAEQAFDAGYLVSAVELSSQEAPFSKFELVLAAIIRNISSAETEYAHGAATPLADVLWAVLQREADERGCALPDAISSLTERLYAEPSIDVDMKRVVAAFWATFAGDVTDTVVLEERRGFLMQWFTGEAHRPQMRKEFGVQKAVAKENARLILSSLSALTRLLGFRGLVVLFDESEMTHSTMSKTNLKQAHNNLLHLINEIGEVPGILMLYAAVPEFFNNPKTGIVIYGALAARIGKLEDKPPSALASTWNLDAMDVSEEQYREAAVKIRRIYERAFPEDAAQLLPTDELQRRVDVVVREHGQFEAVSRWRAVVTEAIKVLDASLEGRALLEPLDSYHETKSMLERLGDD